MRDEIVCVALPATPEDVQDDGYLDANPDVRSSGLTPKAHFIALGRAEHRVQLVNAAEIRAMRDSKLARLAFKCPPGAAREPGKPVGFLSDQIIAEFSIPDLCPVSAHPYPASVVQLIHDNRDKLFLDVGAGLRDVYYRNVVNTEIYPSVSTDVLCVGEAMPFADNQFDFVFCFATLEHTKRPWDVASEICRVLKPGGTAMIDYPFMQPVHGYPHHYFNATPMGNRSLFERDCDIRSVTVGWHQHPMVGLQWILTVFRNGLPEADARRFEQLQIKDLLDVPLDSLLAESFCCNLHTNMQQAIASGSMVEAVKKGANLESSRNVDAVCAATSAIDPGGVSPSLRARIETIARLKPGRLSWPFAGIGRIRRADHR
jgi:SAM-dependent methyltransferase